MEDFTINISESTDFTSNFVTNSSNISILAGE